MRRKLTTNEYARYVELMGRLDSDTVVAEAFKQTPPSAFVRYALAVIKKCKAID